MNTETYESIIKLWNYLSVGELNESCDVAFVLGRDDFSVPEKTVEIYNNNLVSKLILVGGRGRLTGSIEGSESEAFRKYLLAHGVNAQDIFMEEVSTNTGENIVAGLALLKENNQSPKKICLITHGPHMRRALAVAKARDASIEWLPCPDNCVPPSIDSGELREVAKELVGEMARLESYPKLSYFAEQNIPQEITDAKVELDLMMS